MRLIDLLQFGTSELQKAAILEYENDARLLLEDVLDKSRTELFLAADSPVDRHKCEKYASYLERRKKREPVAYILGEQEFWSLPFYVSPDVLIPRSETEFLLDRVFAKTKPENFSNGRILDLCSGSGVIATILAKETGQTVFAADISWRALQVTQKNATRHSQKNSVQVVLSDLLAAFCDCPVFSLIVSNPPYVSRFDIDHSLEPEVSCFEPHLALDGGVHGLESIAKIRQELPKVLLDGGQFFMEIGADQGKTVYELFKRKTGLGYEFQHVEILKDYAGRDRVLHARMAIH
jgi:release factor glutamine methyltransferase